MLVSRTDGSLPQQQQATDLAQQVPAGPQVAGRQPEPRAEGHGATGDMGMDLQLGRASDSRDHKFFGFAISDLSTEEVRERWRCTPDRSGTAGTELAFFPMATPRDYLRILSRIADNPDDWAPEAVFVPGDP